MFKTTVKYAKNDVRIVLVRKENKKFVCHQATDTITGRMYIFNDESLTPMDMVKHIQTEKVKHIQHIQTEKAWNQHKRAA